MLRSKFWFWNIDKTSRRGVGGMGGSPSIICMHRMSLNMISASHHPITSYHSTLCTLGDAPLLPNCWLWSKHPKSTGFCMRWKIMSWELAGTDGIYEHPAPCETHTLELDWTNDDKWLLLDWPILCQKDKLTGSLISHNFTNLVVMLQAK